MRNLVLALLCLTAQNMRGGCLSFLDPPDGSGCSRSNSELAWLNSNRLLERVSVPGLPYDPQIQDPALGLGLAVKGDLLFELHPPGQYLVEVFLATPDDPTRTFVLESGGKPVDTRRQASGGSAGLRSVCLLGILNGAFTVHTDSPRYIISAIRWTPRGDFEEKSAPAWLERARRLLADPFLDGLRAGRRESLEQLYDRLALSRVPEVRREAVIGLARATYWLAAEEQKPQDIARLAVLLQEALKLAPDDKIVREMASSSCRLWQGSSCAQTAPVPWTVNLPPDPADAPAWTVTQRRLAARMQAITEWWVRRRQQSDGQLGGGWAGDAAMLGQWGPQALGFGSAEATAGFEKLAAGLRSSGLAVGDVAVAADFQTPETALSRMAALAKENEAALAGDFEMYTSEVIYTDRVPYRMSPEYGQFLLGGVYPARAVTWPVSDAQFARAVLESKSDSLKLRLYNFENRPAKVLIRPYRLEPGKYHWQSADPAGVPIAHGEFSLSRRGDPVALPLPPAREIAVDIQRIQP